ncbi:prepilin peptidase [Pseudomaricurvus alkylphenolicus]|uniref:prepilin peptidase n=1 Tax=Pseudomaricurvus alkylphenolicus TaxID=1306991 RepID=UPI00141FA7EE|nr:A24 family peptidase [Pseudomaricurvus alkylphenolicus]NIB40044.1 prepilin peptidase [Pseudomaricurvus alkylphenolicus]
MTATELAGDSTGLFIALATILGLVVGSFLNVVIHRLPKMMQNAWRQDCCELLEVENPEAGKPYNLLKPDSHCPKCRTPIKPWQNIPIVSYLMLKGRCGNCQEPISKRYPIIEAVTGLISGYVAFQFGWSEQAIAVLLLSWALISLTMIDIDHQLLPDNITLPLVWLGVLVNSQGLFTDLESSVFGAIGGYLSLWSVFWLFKILTGKEGMGYGDFKLLAALGAWMGWQMLPLVIILSSFVGAAIGIIGIVVQGRDKSVPIPFGPYLAIAGWIALLWGDIITNQYLQFAGVN